MSTTTTHKLLVYSRTAEAAVNALLAIRKTHGRHFSVAEHRLIRQACAKLKEVRAMEKEES